MEPRSRLRCGWTRIRCAQRRRSKSAPHVRGPKTAQMSRPCPPAPRGPAPTAALNIRDGVFLKDCNTNTDDSVVLELSSSRFLQTTAAPARTAGSSLFLEVPSTCTVWLFHGLIVGPLGSFFDCCSACSSAFVQLLQLLVRSVRLHVPGPLSNADGTVPPDVQAPITFARRALPLPQRYLPFGSR